MNAGRVFEIAFAINATLQGSFSNAMNSANRSMQALGAQAKEIKAAQGQLEAQWKTGAAQIRNYGAQLGKLSQDYQRGKINEATFRAETAKLTQAAKSAGIGLDEYRSHLNRLQGEMTRTVSAQKGLQAAMAARQIAGMGFIEAKSNFMSAAINTYMGVQMFKGPIDEAIKFQSAMADVRKVVDFDTPEQFQAMNKDILALTRSLPMSAEGLAKIVAAGGQAGIARDQLLQFAESAAKMGVAFDITAEQAGDMMAKWRTAFKMNQDQVVALADQINYLGNTTAASAPLISDVVTRIGPLGKIGGVASGEIAALGATMIGSGIESEVAATGIKNLILTMVSGESATDRQATALQELGMDAEALAQRMQVDAKGAILDLFDALKNIDPAAQGAILKDLVGKESIASISPLVSNLDALKENLEKVADASQYSGSMQTEFETRCKTAENSLQLMKNAASEAAINVGSVFLPAISGAAKEVAGMTGGLAEWAAVHPGIIKGVALLAGGLMALNLYIKGTLVLSKGLAAAQALGTQIMAVQSAATALAAASGQKLTLMQRIATAAQWAWNTALAANPIGLFIAGVVALIAAGYLLYKNWDTVKEFFSHIFDSPAAEIALFLLSPIGPLILIAKEIITNWEEVKTWFSTFLDDPRGHIEQFGAYIMGKFQRIAEYVMNKWEQLKYVLSNPITASINLMEGKTVYGGDTSSEYNGKSYDISGVGADYIPGESAAGGIFTRPYLTWVAEAGSAEAIVPLDGSKRAVGLWEQAGKMLGVMPTPTLAKQIPDESADTSGGLWDTAQKFVFGKNGRGSAGKETIPFTAPPIAINLTFNGPADAGEVKDAVTKAASTAQRSWAEQYMEFRRERARVSYE